MACCPRCLEPAEYYTDEYGGYYFHQSWWKNIRCWWKGLF